MAIMDVLRVRFGTVRVSPVIGLLTALHCAEVNAGPDGEYMNIDPKPGLKVITYNELEILRIVLADYGSEMKRLYGDEKGAAEAKATSCTIVLEEVENATSIQIGLVPCKEGGVLPDGGGASYVVDKSTHQILSMRPNM